MKAIIPIISYWTVCHLGFRFTSITFCTRFQIYFTFCKVYNKFETYIGHLIARLKTAKLNVCNINYILKFPMNKCQTSLALKWNMIYESVLLLLVMIWLDIIRHLSRTFNLSVIPTYLNRHNHLQSPGILTSLISLCFM